MKKMPAACLPECIADFLAGKLTDAQCVWLEEHLEGCEDCDRLLASATAERPFWDDARAFLKSGHAGDAKAVSLELTQPDDSAECIDRELKALLDPTDDPRMLGRFGGYEIAGVIGRGGMGLVFKGLDVSLDRYVAIKVLNPTYGSSPAGRTRFAREAKAAASVVHDNVVPIYGVDEFKGVPYLVMPYVKTQSLQQRIDREAPLPVETTLEIAVQIARGLAVAHEQGLVHRDIKPSNILMPSSVSRVQITDFGLARAADDASLTQSGVIAGTPQYMSPEQARGDAVDGRTDQFSLGSVIYAMLTGDPPFRSETMFGTLRRITDQPHRPLTQVQPLVPVWLSKLVDRLLSKHPDGRFDSTAELADHLEDCLAHHRQPATVVLPRLEIKRSTRFGLRSQVLFAMVFIFLIGVSLLISASWHLRNHFTDSISNPAIRSMDVSNLPEWDFDDGELIGLENEVRRLGNELDTNF